MSSSVEKKGPSQNAPEKSASLRRRVGIRELRQNASPILEEVKRGMQIEVTDRGIPVAIISPYEREIKKTLTREELIARGMLIPAKKKLDLATWKPLESKSMTSLSQILIEEREKERY
jgi:prevent-host-death family protein